MIRRVGLSAMAAALLLPAVSGLGAYPEKPVRIIVPFAPGGNIDITARAVAPGLAEALGQPVVVDNRGGGGGRIGTTLVAKAPPDGYTLLLGASGTLTVQPAFYQTKVKFLHVPYKGAGAAMVDLISGQAHLMFDQLSASGPHIKAGRLRPLAVTTLKRSSHMPEAPTIDESGVRGFEASTYTGIVLPAATPGDVVRALRAALLKVLDQPATRDTFTRLGADVIKSTPEEFARRVQHDYAKWTRIRKETGIKLE